MYTPQNIVRFRARALEKGTRWRHSQANTPIIERGDTVAADPRCHLTEDHGPRPDCGEGVNCGGRSVGSGGPRGLHTRGACHDAPQHHSRSRNHAGCKGCKESVRFQPCAHRTGSHRQVDAFPHRA